MARGNFQPQDFGIDVEKNDFMDEMVNHFSDFTKGQISLDELLLRPDSAKAFCNQVRAITKYFDLPDDIILRSVMSRRKNPN